MESLQIALKILQTREFGRETFMLSCIHGKRHCSKYDLQQETTGRSKRLETERTVMGGREFP